MPREGYIEHLRQIVGREPLLLPSVAVLVRDGRCIVVGLHRDGDWWVIPGGALEPGELPAAAAIREVWEETRLDVEIIGLRGVYGGKPEDRVTYPNGDVVDYVVTVFEARVVGGVLAGETEEFSSLRWVPEADLGELDLAPWMAPMFAHPGFEPPQSETASPHDAPSS